jgi:hypothetical protein
MGGGWMPLLLPRPAFHEIVLMAGVLGPPFAVCSATSTSQAAIATRLTITSCSKVLPPPFLVVASSFAQAPLLRVLSLQLSN